MCCIVLHSVPPQGRAICFQTHHFSPHSTHCGLRPSLPERPCTYYMSQQPIEAVVTRILSFPCLWQDGMPPLSLAASKGLASTVDVLLQSGVPVNGIGRVSCVSLTLVLSLCWPEVIVVVCGTLCVYALRFIACSTVGLP